jgi:2Fe-2S ferredoxin
MITIHFIRPDGQKIDVQSQPGHNAMEAAMQANVPGIEADCGGLMTCATCHVYVDDSRLPLPQEDELTMLEFTAAPRQPNSRLSCQIMLSDALNGLTLTLPDKQH